MPSKAELDFRNSRLDPQNISNENPKLSYKELFYYTPKAFGVDEIEYRGFDLNQIYLAGSNPASAPRSTWDLLNFHIKRLILYYIHEIIGIYLWLEDIFQLLAFLFEFLFWRLLDALVPVPPTQIAIPNPRGAAWKIQRPLRAARGFTVDLPTARATRRISYTFSTPFLREIISYDEQVKTRKVPETLMLLLKQRIFNTPPPPVLPAPYLNADKILVEPTVAELEAAQQKVRDFKQQLADWRALEAARITRDTGLFIVSALALLVRPTRSQGDEKVWQLTVFEATGNSWRNIRPLIGHIRTLLKELYGEEEFSEPTTLKPAIGFHIPALGKHLRVDFASPILRVELYNPGSAEQQVGLQVVLLSEKDSNFVVDLARKYYDKINSQIMEISDISADEICQQITEHFHAAADLAICPDNPSTILKNFPTLSLRNDCLFYSGATPFSPFILLQALDFYAKYAPPVKTEQKETKTEKLKQ